MRFKEDIPEGATHQYLRTDGDITYYRRDNFTWKAWWSTINRWKVSWNSARWPDLIPIAKSVGDKMCEAF